MQKDERAPSQQHTINHGYSNVVAPTDKPCLDSVFSGVRNKKIKKKKKATKANDVAMNYVLTIPTRHENFSRWVKSDTIQRARLTRASCSMKDPIDPIVISDVSHRITFISASITYLGGL